MNIKYYQETKVTKKTDTKEPVKVVKEGFVNEFGDIKSFWDFFKDFGDEYINIAVSFSNKIDLVESDPESDESKEV